MNIPKSILWLGPFGLCCGLPFIPGLSGFGLAVFLLAFVALILVGLKAAHRAHPAGLFAQWFAPGALIKAKLSKGEAQIVTVAIASMVGLCLGFLLLISTTK